MVPRAASAAPVDIEASRASAAPRKDSGDGICATAVHLSDDDLLTSVTVAETYLAQPVGTNRVDDKVSFQYRTVNLKNSDGAAGGDFSEDSPLPFTALSGTPKAGNERNIAMRVRGYLNIRRAGVYTLGVLADDGFRLRVAGTEVLKSEGFASLRNSRQVSFKGTGLFPIELVYYQNSGAAILELSKADREDFEAVNSPQRLPDSFQLVPQAELYTAVAGAGDCNECDSDGACGAANQGKYCRDGLCQRCIVDDHCGASCAKCGADAPVCNGTACVECSSANTRVCDAKGFVCDQNQCRACLADTECGFDQNGFQKICDLAFGQCVPRQKMHYAGGCSVGAGEPAGRAGLILPALLLLLGLALRSRQQRRSSFRRGAAALTGLAALGLAAPAQAQTADTVTFNAQTFRPTMGPGNLITVEGTLMPRSLWPMGGVWLQFADRPLRLVVDGTGETYANTVPAMFTAHVMPGLGITRWMSIALDLPIVLYQGFDERTPALDTNFLTPTSAGVGDLRLMTKFRILNNEEGGFGLAAAPQFTFPTGSATSFRSDDTVGIEPRIAADYRFKRGIFIALNVGYWLRTYNRNVDFNFGLNRVSDQLRYGIGIGAPIIKGFGLVGEINGAVSFAKLEGGSLYTPLEGLAALRYTHSSGLEITAGGGGAFIAAIGTPQARGFLGIGYVPTGKRAQRRAETSELPPPNPDLDGDGLLAGEDKCPNKAGPKENAGCPDTDEDKDGVVDRLDKCPKDAGSAENNGCADADEDKDGVVDRLDKCPKDVGVAELGGCPEPDTDKDGVLDKNDKCVDKAGPADNAGCPDADEDKDAIVDRLDKCPSEAGPKETSGCPLLRVTEAGPAKLLLPIKFAAGKATLEKESGMTIAALAKLLQEDTSIKKMAIGVGASGDKKAAKKLVGARVKILTAALVAAGAPKKLLLVKAAKQGGSDEITQVILVKGKVKGAKGKGAKAPKGAKAKKGKKGKK